MLYLNLRKILDNKGIENHQRYLTENGFTIHMASRLLNNIIPSISYKNLEHLCLLLQCLPNDLFSWRATDVNKNYKDQPLNKLLYKENKGNITSKLKQLPLDKLEQVRKFIDDIDKAESPTPEL